jgi:LmbE family N-acetylglucosaminyl deacetylase
MRKFSITGNIGQALCIILILIISLSFLNFGQISPVKGNAKIDYHIEVSDILKKSNGKRILIFAPHPDDEVVATGGLISEAVKEGFTVKVVFITNGDGFGNLVKTGSLIKINNANEAITLGYEREIEAIQAAKVLGLKSENLIFLGYPDRGISHLWFSNWSKAYTSIYTFKSCSPYNNSYTQKVSYKGENLSKDIRSILDSFKPDLVFTPSYFDMHPDHWGTSCFVISELATLEEMGRGWVREIKIYFYLVHYGKISWPKEWGYKPLNKILPPLELQRARIKWLSYPLSETAVQIKLAAISKYKSQVVLIGNFLKAFVRTNELFEELSSLDTAFIIDPETHLIKEEFIKIRGIKPLEINFVNKGLEFPKLYRFLIIGYKANIVLFIKNGNNVSQKRTKLYLNNLNSQINKDKILIDFATEGEYKNLYAAYLNIESYFLLPLFPIYRSNWIFFRRKDL